MEPKIQLQIPLSQVFMSMQNPKTTTTTTQQTN
jgi:hypothetical protein